MKVKISDHQGKSDALRQALEEYGHEIVYSHADILLIDFDGPVAHYPKIIERAYEQGANVYLYSHGAMPLTCWDGIWTPSDKIAGFLAQTPGQKQVMEAYSYPHPVHVIGWHYSEQRKFQPTSGNNVLFAPWHPQGTGWLIPEGMEANKRVYGLLRQIPDINLTVRFVGGLALNGLPHEEDIEYEISNKSIDAAIESILRADIVVSYGTLAYLAVALGKPCVMYGQNCTPYDGYNELTLAYVKNWHLYRDIMHYAHDGDVDDVVAFRQVMERACREEDSDWRALFIGEQFDAFDFVELMEQLHRERDD